ncbi:MAG: redox-regulated ATPase YchF [Holosporales bacterium]|jgi:GTP-binding protein YchF|nr:redox-regulated ATPase YchF [Holosporales bacterium]
MGLKCGIIGLPNVGKSTLFNALTQTASARAANYPFCTIEPNIGRIAVPDPRLDPLAQLAQSQETIPTFLDIVDIAGLVRGASKGEGLGNQFLGHIREVEAILHVLRCFEDKDVTHVEGPLDPIRDQGIVETELLLADLESLERRGAEWVKKARGKDPEAEQAVALLASLRPFLESGKPARLFPVSSEEERRTLKKMQLLTSKPVLSIANVAESDVLSGNTWTQTLQQSGSVLLVSAAIESEIASLPLEEQEAYLQEMGLQESGLSRVVREGYALLELITFFTAGPKETRAWTVRKGVKAPEAAGVIHTDFEKGFICAETIGAEDFVAFNGEAGARAAGKARLEGREYQVQDGDIFHFRFNKS